MSLLSRDIAKKPVAIQPAAFEAYRYGNRHLIELRRVIKTYQSAAGSFTALNGIDIQVDGGEFVAVIGKSGSGKSTLINMVTAIDRPTSGEVLIGDTAVHTLSEGQAAVWRGHNVGIVFQFFQLLPTLSLVQNVMLPLDFRRLCTPRERLERAMLLLDRVGMAEHARKLPSAISGGQQQRVAIARALANDPPVLIADEPTGNLDSKAAESVFELFTELARDGKTILMVTHDNDLVSRVDRAIIVVDGRVVNQFVASVLATLDLDELSQTTSKLVPMTFPPGSVIVREGDAADRFYIVTKGWVEVSIRHPGGQQIVVARLGPGRYFGEIGILRYTRRNATVRAGSEDAVEVMTLDAEEFRSMVAGSSVTGAELHRTIQERLAQTDAARQS